MYLGEMKMPPVDGRHFLVANKTFGTAIMRGKVGECKSGWSANRKPDLLSRAFVWDELSKHPIPLDSGFRVASFAAQWMLPTPFFFVQLPEIVSR